VATADAQFRPLESARRLAAAVFHHLRAIPKQYSRHIAKLDDENNLWFFTDPVSAEYWDNRGINRNVKDADQHAKVAM
jgi:hypothetical protein